MKNSSSFLTLLPLGIFAAAMVFCPTMAKAQFISSTVSEDNRATTNGTDTNQDLYDVLANHPAVVTAGAGYDFSASYMSLTSIQQITLTMTMFDGDSGAGQFDLNHLHFYVGGTRNATTGIYTGGIDTGIVLNGFRGNGFIDTLTFSLLVNPATTGAAILSALNANGGILPAYVVTDNPNDTQIAPNEVALTNNLNNATTTLTFSSVPEPASCALFGAGALLLLAPQVRRFRKNI
jgi:hypothetical protein